MSVTSEVHDAPHAGHLVRSVGFYGLLFVSLGSIIGSGWLLGALNAAELAGPASILAWFLAALMLGLLALVYAELGATYPVAGAGGRFSYYSHGNVAGFTSGWASWLQAVFIAPIEVLACVEYSNSTAWMQDHFNMLNSDGFLNTRGYIVSIALMLIFMAMNLAGAEFMSESNSYVVLWKFAVPVLAILVVATLQFDGGNFTAGGGFMPHGMHGVFAALTGGVVFATQGFEQAVQFAGEARNPRRDISRAILIAMLLGAVLYSALQIALIGAVEPSHVLHNWDNPLGGLSSNVGAWYTLAVAVGAGWLAKVILVDAVISPAGTGVVYLGTTARLSYALGEEDEMPAALARTSPKGVPVISILLATVIGCIAFGPFPSWQSLVSAVTGATAVMYGMAPIALGALRSADADRPRTYQVPFPGFVLPASFASANLILYFGGFDTMYKVIGALVLGLALFAIGSSRARTSELKMIKHALWVPAWLVGMLVISALGRYGDSQLNVLPSWIDLLVVIVFSCVIYYWAVSQALSPEDVRAQVAHDAHQLDVV